MERDRIEHCTRCMALTSNSPRIYHVGYQYRYTGPTGTVGSGAQLGQSSPLWTPAARTYSRRSSDEKGARWDMTG